MSLELASSWYSRSLALASDAGHMLADASALLLAIIAQQYALRRATRVHTYGFRRAETLAAFVNGIALVAMAAWVLHEAWTRWWNPVTVRGPVVLAVGAAGLVVNLGIAGILSRGGHSNANTRAALAHVLYDAIGSVMAMLAGLLAWTLGWNRVDALLSALMAGLIVFGAWAILRSTVAVLMEGTPPGLDVAAVERTIRETPGVQDVHDLHAWCISDGFELVTAHVRLDGSLSGTGVVRDVGRRVREAHGIVHVTVQPEGPDPSEGAPAQARTEGSG